MGQECCGSSVNPNDWYAFGAWGNALTARARSGKEGDVANRLYAEAVDKFEAALAIEPSNPAVMFDFAQLLLAVARKSAPADAYGLYARACEMLESSDRLEPFDAQGLQSWAIALLERFEAGSGEVDEDVVAKAVQKLEVASKAEPANAETLQSWGYALMIQATATFDEDVTLLLAQAAARTEAALKIEPRMREALQCLAVIRMRQATRLGDTAGKTLLEEAKEKLLASEAGCAAEGTDEANKAAMWSRVLRSCVHARLGEEDAAIELLTAERKAGSLPARDEILTDPDLACLRSRPRLREIFGE